MRKEIPAGILETGPRVRPVQQPAAKLVPGMGLSAPPSRARGRWSRFMKPVALAVCAHLVVFDDKKAAGRRGVPAG